VRNQQNVLRVIWPTGPAAVAMPPRSHPIPGRPTGRSGPARRTTRRPSTATRMAPPRTEEGLAFLLGW